MKTVIEIGTRESGSHFTLFPIGTTDAIHSSEETDLSPREISVPDWLANLVERDGRAHFSSIEDYDRAISEPGA